MIRIITKHKTLIGILCIVTGIIIFNVFSIAFIAIGIAFFIRAYYSSSDPESIEDDNPLSRMQKGRVISDTRSGQEQMSHQQMGNSPISQAYLKTCASCGGNISETGCTRCRTRKQEDKITQYK